MNNNPNHTLNILSALLLLTFAACPAVSKTAQNAQCCPKPAACAEKNVKTKKKETKNKDLIKIYNKELKASVFDYQSNVVNTNWWNSFNDSMLSYYINKTLKSNYDIKIANLNVLEYEQIVRTYFGQEFPVLSIGADATVQKYSKNYIPAFSGKIENYTFPLRASYEVDLWGKNRSATKAQKKILESQIYDEKSALISVVSQAASTYFNILKTQKNIELQTQIVSLRQQIYNLVKARYDVGISPIEDVLEAQNNATSAETQLTQLKNDINAFKTSLAVLINESPENISEMKFGDISQYKDLLAPVGEIKSDKILNRPDILSAEAQLQKAKIDIALARKAFLPDITLTGQAGFNARFLNKVWDSDSFTYGAGASIFETLFSGGQRRAGLKAKKYAYERNFALYQKTILTSLKEVNDSISAINTSMQLESDFIKRLEVQRNIDRLTTLKYDAGLISLLDSLRTRESILSLQQQFINTKAALYINQISLYNALGANL